MYSIAICAHEKRFSAAKLLSEKVDGTLVLDNEDDSVPVLVRSARTHDRAWEVAAQAGEEWSVVLEDDALPVDGFLEALSACLAAATPGVVSLYLGDQSIPVRARQAAERAEKNDACWVREVRHPGLYWGVGVALPTRLVSGMLEGVNGQRFLNPYDERLGLWALENGVPVNYVFPSLVDHDDGVSLIGLHSVRRRAQRTGVRDRYDGKTVVF